MNYEQNKELLDKYDMAVGTLMLNLYSLSKNSESIILSNIDRNNKEHLLVLRTALIAKDIYNRQVLLHTNLWNWIVLNWRMRKLTHRVPREKSADMLIDVNEVLDFMRPTFVELIGEDFNFGHVYDAFYKGELD